MQPESEAAPTVKPGDTEVRFPTASRTLEQRAGILQGRRMCLALSRTWGHATSSQLRKLTQLSPESSFHRCLLILLSSKVPLNISVTELGSDLLLVA